MIQILKKISFFSGLADADLESIGKTIQLEYYPADHVLFKEGVPGDKMYIIKRGSVQVVRGNTILAVLKEGSFFGEMALVSDEPRNATIKTVTDLEVLTLGKSDFQALLSSKPSIAEIVSFEIVKRANQIF